MALHAYNRNMYFRDLNYKKFQFSQFFATDDEPKLTNLNTIDSAWYTSDKSFYADVLKKVSNSSGNKFYQVVTMQNHMPYEDFYQDNEFKDLDTSDLPSNEKLNLDTYTKGLNYTDQSTLDFLNSLDDIDRPITVLFYGDHLPGIYSTAYSDKNNIIGLHETDYFIWSNQRPVRRTPNLTPLPAITPLRTISPPSSPSILTRRSARILRSSPKCIRRFRLCPCRIPPATRILRRTLTRTANSSRRKIFQSRRSSCCMTTSSFNTT